MCRFGCSIYSYRRKNQENVCFQRACGDCSFWQLLSRTWYIEIRLQSHLGQCNCQRRMSHLKEAKLIHSHILRFLVFPISHFSVTMHFSHVHTEKVPGGAYFTAEFTIIHESSGKMDTFDMLVKITLVSALLPALSTLKTNSILAWNYVIVKWDCPTWKNFFNVRFHFLKFKYVQHPIFL